MEARFFLSWVEKIIDLYLGGLASLDANIFGRVVPLLSPAGVDQEDGTLWDALSMRRLPLIDTRSQDILRKPKVAVFRPRDEIREVDQNPFAAETMERNLVHVPTFLVWGEVGKMGRGVTVLVKIPRRSWGMFAWTIAMIG